MRGPRLLVAFALLASVVVSRPSPAVAPAPQGRGVTSPQRFGESVAIGADLSRYEAMYGTPEFRAIDDENARPWPRKHSIRTVGTFAEIPGKQGNRTVAVQLGRMLELNNDYAQHMVCGQTRCVAVVPVPEMLEAFGHATHSWVQQDVEVIAAIDNIADPRQPPIWAFRVWSLQLRTGGLTHKGPAKGSSLETLVMNPGSAAGRTITVSGTFRGANLFDDLPAESRRLPMDWVLRDGPFSVWVTGKPPRGSGWSLDPASRADCVWRVEVQGTSVVAGGFVYVKAKRVTLLGRARDGADFEAR